MMLNDDIDLEYVLRLLGCVSLPKGSVVVASTPNGYKMFDTAAKNPQWVKTDWPKHLKSQVKFRQGEKILNKHEIYDVEVKGEFPKKDIK